MKGSYSIKDLEKLTGIKAHTLRIWEKRYGLLSPERTDTNIRMYCDDDLKKLLNTMVLYNSGQKISAIAKLKEEELHSRVTELTSTNNNYEIESMIVSMLDMNEVRFEQVLNSLFLRYGVEKAVLEYIYPLMEKIGVLWQVGTINPAQEHYISQIIRQKMIVEIDKQNRPAEPKGVFLLYLPEGELHELGLLFYNYIIKSRGFDTVYLGQSVPYEDLKLVCELKTPDFIFTSVVAPIERQTLKNYIKNLNKDYSDVPTYVTGLQTEGQNDLSTTNVRVVNRVPDFITILENL